MLGGLPGKRGRGDGGDSLAVMHTDTQGRQGLETWFE